MKSSFILQIFFLRHSEQPVHYVRCSCMQNTVCFQQKSIGPNQLLPTTQEFSLQWRQITNRFKDSAMEFTWSHTLPLTNQETRPLVTSRLMSQVKIIPIFFQLTHMHVFVQVYKQIRIVVVQSCLLALCLWRRFCIALHVFFSDWKCFEANICM